LDKELAVQTIPCRVLVAFASLLATLPASEPRVPEGFTVELVAGAEQVQHPMMGCFDDVGRLYICESAGTNRKAADLIADPQDSIKVLEDADGDGKYEKSWTFADKLVFPQGCLWYRGSVYTCSSPYLWKLTDTDGDGVCDERTVLVKSFGFSGNAADIHGPFLSPDGRLYWCDGRHGHEIHDLGDGRIGGDDNVATVEANPEPGLPNPDGGELLTKGKAARIFSCRTDGSDLRVLCGGGMDNPVEVDFWETGECLGTVNLFYGRPRGDCLVHWVEGGVYPRDDMPDCIAEFPWTGGLLGPVTNYGHVAVSGMCRYRSKEFGDLTAAATRTLEGSGSLADRAAFFVTEFNTHKVVQTIVERHGATFRAVETSDFLVSDDPDFHPTDVLEDADGSLLAINTGGWFRIGCPTSQVAKPEIAGGIWRIRKVGAHLQSRPREIHVRDTVDSTLDREQSLELFLTSGTPSVRRAAAGALYRRAGTAAGANACTLLPAELHALVGILAKHPVDDVERHAAIAALTAAGDAEVTRSFLASEQPSAVQRAALIALDQMENGNLTREEVLPLLATSDAALREAALDVISRRDGWAGETITLFQSWLAAELSTEQADILRRFIAAQAPDPAIQAFVAESAVRDDLPVARRLVLLEALNAAEVAEWPAGWTPLVTSLLAAADPDLKLSALAIIRNRGRTEFDPHLQRQFVDEDQPPAVRIEALAALGTRREQIEDAERRFISEFLRSDADLLLRLRLASAYASGPCSPVHTFTIAGLTKSLGPTFVPAFWPAFQQAESPQRQKHIIAVLREFDDLPGISDQQLRDLLIDYSTEAQAEAAPLLEKLLARRAAAIEKIERYLPWADGGDADRGRYVFFGQTAACGKCHRIGNDGAQIGPDLTKIGGIRQPRDLVESILLPSASFARDFHPYSAVTTDGRVVSGLISRQSSDSVVLRLTDLSEVRLPRAEIEVLKEAETSIMPQGLEAKLNEQEFRDLLAFLQSLK
jgi:putative heme-binding domain-containing protein